MNPWPWIIVFGIVTVVLICCGIFLARYDYEDDVEKKKRYRKRLIAAAIISYTLNAVIPFVTFLYEQFAEDITMPDLIQMSIEDAEIALDKAGLYISVKTEWNAETEEGLIFKQTPVEGTIIRKGRIVNVVVSKGEEPTEPPDTDGPDITTEGSTTIDLGTDGLTIPPEETTAPTQASPWTTVPDGTPIPAPTNPTTKKPTAAPLYTVKFHGNGGTISGNTSKTVSPGQSIGTMPTATRTGYIFEGWADSPYPTIYPEGSEAGPTWFFYYATTPVTKNLELHAKWQPLETEVGFDPDEVGIDAYSDGSTYLVVIDDSAWH